MNIVFVLKLVVLALYTGCAHPSQSSDPYSNLEHEFSVSEEVADGKSAKFIAHTADRPFGSYLSINLPFTPMNPLGTQVEQKLGVQLKHRGEAHITVITPPEYDKVLKKFMSIQEINEIATQPIIDGSTLIQRSTVRLQCLGEGKVKQGAKTLRTYYIVVSSEDLLAVRQRVAAVYLKNIKLQNLDPSTQAKFDPKKFYPHITVGFTDRDLHESDGVVKNDLSCIGKVN